ncbi:MAG: hypothetical protein R3325_05480 [Thermoanaerobaculia bacterium]|nr:hypothetical protein [Thermoanaerobaculia bacterium]
MEIRQDDLTGGQITALLREHLCAALKELEPNTSFMTRRLGEGR